MALHQSEHRTSDDLDDKHNSRLAYGKIIVPGHLAALRRAAEICAGGYQSAALW